MSARSITSYDELQHVLTNEEHFEELVQQISVTVTEMFRDPTFFLALRETGIKRLATYPVIKVWIAGCATGQEAYSVAILLSEHDLLERSIIYGTDINQKSLDIATQGIYPQQLVKAYETNYIKSGGKRNLSDYYTEKYGMVRLNKELRKNIVFSPHNLVTDKSFNEFQLIICRNVLIYFNQELQNQVIHLFHESLCHFGLLGLGSKESLRFSTLETNFEPLVKRERIYRKM